MQIAKNKSLWTALAALFFFYNASFAQTSYTWNGNNSSDWDLPANWTPLGVPTAADNVSIAAATNNPALNTSCSVSSLTLTSGIIQLNGHTLTASGATATFSGGTITNGTLSLSLTGIATFSGTTFGAAVSGSAAGLLFNGSTFNSTVSLTKTGSSTDLCSGNNTFNGETTIINKGTSYIRLANATRDIFNADVTFSNTGTSYIDVARSDVRGSLFNGNIKVNSTSGTGINFGLGSGVAVVAAGKTISVGNLGFTAGTLALRNFQQEDDTPLHIALSGTSTLSLQSGSFFNGPLSTVSPSLALNGSTFNGTSVFEKTGSTSNTFLGGNTFNGTTTIINSGTNFIRLANSNRDTFNADVTFTNAGTSYIDVARHDAIGTAFNGNIIVNSTSGTGVHFGQGNGTAVLADGKTIRVGSSGFTSGSLILSSFTQTGNTAQNITLGGTAIFSFQPGSTFNAPVTVAAPGIIVTGTTFNAPASFLKTGSGTNNGAGGNTFHSTATISNSGSGVFNLNNDGIDSFHEDIFFNSSSTGGIRFGQSTGSATLAASKTIRFGDMGFSSGSLMLRNFTQLGDAPVNLAVSGPATVSLQAGTVLGGNVTIVAHGIALDGATFHGTSSFTKTGASSTSAGGNTFHGAAVFTNSGSSFLRLSNVNRDIFNSDVTFTNSATGTSYIDVARNDVRGTEFNGNVFVNSTSGTGIYICPAAGTGTAVLAQSKTISVGSTGFTAGGLYLRNLTQAGATPQTITLGGTSTQLHLLTGTIFNGSLNATAPSLFLSGATFNGTTTLRKTGSSSNNSTGGCTFNGVTTITNSGTGNLTLANSTGDDFNGSVQFVQLGKGLLQPAFNGTNTFAGDISTAGSTAAINFANGADGRVVIAGAAPQFFRGDAAFQPQVQRLTMATTDKGKLTLEVNLNVMQELAFGSGIIAAVSTGSDESGLLVLHNDINFSEMPHSGSHVTGYVRKVGNSDFTFPTGSGNALRPIAITAPALATDHFTAAYFNTDPGTRYTSASREGDLTYLSHLEYWMLDRTGGESEAEVRLWWDEQSNITDPKSLLVARWNGSSWVSEGSGIFSENGKSGSVGTKAAVSAFSPFTFGSVYTPFETNTYTIQGALPVELVSFTATPRATEVLLKWRTASEKDNDYFTVERSADGKQFEEVAKVKGSGTSSSPRNYEASDAFPLPGTSYYRLRQTDVDGTSKYSSVVAVTSTNRQQQEISVYPNPSDGTTIAIALPATSDKKLSVAVVDVQGKNIYSATVTTPAANAIFKIEPTQKLKAGVYVVKVSGSQGSFSKKLVVQ